MLRKPTYTGFSLKNTRLIYLGALTSIFFAVQSKAVNAQQLVLGGGSSGSTSGGSGSSTKGLLSLLQYAQEQMVAVGASVSVIFALGVVFAVKFGWMQKDKIKDFFWLICALIAVPTIIPALFAAAQN